MEQKNSKIFSREIMQSVSAFCESENIKDIDQFMYLCFKQGFDIKKYGLLGETLNEGEEHLIKEVIVEKQVIKEILVEVPVEVIKEVEKVVTKIEYISDKSGENELLLKIQQLENEMSKKNEELDELRQKFSTKDTENESFFQNEMSKKNKELDELRRTLDELKNDDKSKLLQETLQKLRVELQEKNLKINELQKINNDLQGINRQGTYLRSSNLKDRL
jgi:DNA repair exonuclease SbcCD ATPase subunit